VIIPMRRIGIDVRYLSHGLVGGVHTYVRSFVPALIELASSREFVLYADTKAPFELGPFRENVELRLLPWSGPLSTIRNDILLRRWMAQDDLDVAHFPANYGLGPVGVPTVLTIHDAINLLPLAEIVRGHPKTAGTMAKMTYLHAWTRLSASRADLVLTVSQHAANEIARHGALPLSRIVPIPHAPAPDLLTLWERPALDAVRRRLKLEQPFILADALKNPATVVDAWRRLPLTLRQSRQVVFFARRPEVSPSVHDAVRSGEARLVVRPSRQDLIALFRLAEAFVFPSWIEGFGLPVLEAMTCGTPVIASNRGAIPEVVGDAGLLADAEDAAAFARHLARVLGNPTEAAQLRHRGRVRAGLFSWERTAGEILLGYERAARERTLAASGVTHVWDRVGGPLRRA